MRRFLSLLLASLLLITLLPSCGEPRETREINGKTYELTFSDEFEGDKLNKKKWELCPEWDRQDAGGRWDHDMTSVRDGHLVLTASMEDGTPVSGAVRTKGLFSQCQGYFEASMQLQHAPGFWGAFWLMDPLMKDEKGNGAVDGAEIDIMESYDAFSGGINHAIHWDGYGPDHQSESYSRHRTALYEGFHTYALEWTETEYIFYIDGEEIWRTDYPGICENELYLKLTIEFGSWAGSYDESQLPDEILVDYVHVYQAVPEK